MSNENFESGDIVYHKINYLKMVVGDTRADKTYVDCIYINPSGSFVEKPFLKVELLKNLPDGEDEVLQMKGDLIVNQKKS